MLGVSIFYSYTKLRSLSTYVARGLLKWVVVSFSSKTIIVQLDHRCMKMMLLGEDARPGSYIAPVVREARLAYAPVQKKHPFYEERDLEAIKARGQGSRSPKGVARQSESNKQLRQTLSYKLY